VGLNAQGPTRIVFVAEGLTKNAKLIAQTITTSANRKKKLFIIPPVQQ
jgi:hypothetical protein